jgi:thiamine-phosphate pyrophosphorylase
MIRIITKPDIQEGEHQIVEALFREGLDELLLRKPGMDLNAQSDWLRQLNPDFHAKVVVYYPELMKSFGCKGIHHRGEVLSIEGAYSGSCHRLEELISYQSGYRFLQLSPIFQSISKPGYGLENKLEINKIPTVLANCTIALGGIEENKLESVYKMGFRHIALLGAIWNSTNPVSVFKKIRMKWESIDQN